MRVETKITRKQGMYDIVEGLESVEDTITTYKFDRSLHHLVKLRVSQINQCAFCVKMHTKEARRDGETNDRLDRLIVWQQVTDFTEREKAALGWTESLTCLHNHTNLGALRSDLKRHFSEQEISLLTAIISMINLWNRIQISSHSS